jgi:hypothetical protein
MKRTLKRELKVLEIAKREAVGTNTARAASASRACQHRLVPREFALGEVAQPCSGGILRL